MLTEPSKFCLRCLRLLSHIYLVNKNKKNFKKKKKIVKKLVDKSKNRRHCSLPLQQCIYHSLTEGFMNFQS